MMIWNDLLNLFFPNLCLSCKEPLIKGEKHICIQCLYKLPKTGFHRRKDNPAEQLFMGKFPFEHATSFLYYEKGSISQILIYALKYKGNKELALYMGILAARDLTISGNYSSVDVIVPVPLHFRRQQVRGYNQAEYIARGIASVLNKPIDIQSLQRIQTNTTQTTKSVFDRWANVQEIFSLSAMQNFAGKHILLVDDVITTGSTIGACAEVILTLPNTRVSLISVAIA